MSRRDFRLFIDELAPGASLALPAAPGRTIYVAAGSVRLEDDASAVSLPENGAWQGGAEANLAAAGGATLLRWELGGAELAGEGVSSRLALGTTIELPAASCLLRCEGQFPAGRNGASAYASGPGIRCLLKGSIRIETAGTTHSYGPSSPGSRAAPIRSSPQPPRPSPAPLPAS